MKIAIVLTNTPSWSETFFPNKIKGLVNSGFDVELYVDKKSTDFDLCPVYELPKGNSVVLFFHFLSTMLRHPFQSIRFLRAGIADGSSFINILHDFYRCLHLLNAANVNWIHFGFATTGVGRENIGNALRAMTAVSFRGYDIMRYPLRHPGVYDRLWKKVSRVHTISESLLKKAYELGLSKSVPYSKITPAVNTNEFKCEITTGGIQSPVRLMTVARLHWSKGLEYTLESLSILHKKGIDFRYTILGDGEDMSRLVLAADQWGILEKVNFMGSIPHPEIKNRLTECDIYIQYSIQEGFCNAVLEAQAMGRFCVVSNAGGLPENVIHDQTGLVVESRNPPALASAIEKAMNLPDKDRLRIRTAAMQRVRDHFTLDQQLRAFIAFYLGAEVPEEIKIPESDHLV